MNKLSSENEFRPPTTDKRWKKDGSVLIYKYKLSYDVDDDLIKSVKRFTSMHDYNLTIKKPDDDISIIFLAENKSTHEKYLGYTNHYLCTFIKYNLHKYNKKEKSIFENFTADGLNQIKFTLIEYVKYDKIKDLINRKNQCIEEYIGGSVDSEEFIEEAADDFNKFYDKRMKVLECVFEKFDRKLEPIYGFIYKITNLDNNKSFIGGSEYQMSKTQFVKKAFDNNNKLDFKINEESIKKITFDLIEKYHASSVFDFMFRIDYHKIKNDTIDNGYNKFYNLEESKDLFSYNFPTAAKKNVQKNIYLKINKLLFELNFTDKHDYSTIFGFVYQLENKNDGKKFFSYVHNKTLKETILSLYDNAMKEGVKHSKISKILAEEPYSNFKIKIMKKK